MIPEVPFLRPKRLLRRRLCREQTLDGGCGVDSYCERYQNDPSLHLGDVPEALTVAAAKHGLDSAHDGSQVDSDVGAEDHCDRNAAGAAAAAAES